jgi:hypothetical protein
VWLIQENFLLSGKGIRLNTKLFTYGYAPTMEPQTIVKSLGVPVLVRNISGACDLEENTVGTSETISSYVGVAIGRWTSLKRLGRRFGKLSQSMLDVRPKGVNLLTCQKDIAATITM